MKKTTTAATLLATILTATTPQHEQMTAVNQSVENIQELTFHQAKSNDVIFELNKLRHSLAMLNSLLAADKFHVNDVEKDIKELSFIRNSVKSVIALVRNYTLKRDNFDEHKNELRVFSNEVFKLDIALGKIKDNHQLFDTDNNGITFSQSELDALVSDSNRVHGA